ncbi:hypothetical protein Gotur_002356 [Gossypium turneri]
MTNHEFMSTRSSKISRYLMLHGPRRMTGFRLDKVDSIPHSIDWRKKGAVTGIRDIAVEGINKMKTGELVALSEQKLVDCGCGTELNHGVAVVGYGETHDGTKYSWGDDF